MGNCWQEIHKLHGTQLCFSSAYHPEIDGQTEVVNKRLGDYLRCFASSKPHTWSRWLPWAEYSYNTLYHVSAKMTPFKIVYGCDLPILICYGTPTSPIDDIDKYLVERDQTLALLKEKLNDAQSAMKSTKDKARRDEELSIGDWVYLKIRPYRMKSLAKRFNAKLAPKSQNELEQWLTNCPYPMVAKSIQFFTSLNYVKSRVSMIRYFHCLLFYLTN